MKKTLLLIAAVIATLAVSRNTFAQEVITKKGYTLTFENNYAALNPALKQRLIETFFEVYPKLATEYNKNTSRKVTIAVDTAYKGVAATSNARVVISSMWMQKHPEDIDVVTHEVMHIVQDYGQSTGPGWLTEGIADYARYKFGVDNATAKWALTGYKPGQNYTQSYRTTAGFLNWVEKSKHAGTVKVLDSKMREHTYTPEIWKAQTGETLDELWTDYTKS